MAKNPNAIKNPLPHGKATYSNRVAINGITTIVMN